MATLSGFFRPRKVSPGFAIPVFNDDEGCTCVQRRDKDDIVLGFNACQVGHISPTQTQLIVSEGDKAIFAFQGTDSNFYIGTRNRLGDKLTILLPTLRDFPFILWDVAEFLDDNYLRKLAKEKCDVEIGRVW